MQNMDSRRSSIRERKRETSLWTTRQQLHCVLRSKWVVTTKRYVLMYGCDVYHQIKEQKRREKEWERGEKGERKKERERDRERGSSRTLHVNRVTFAPRRKLERAQWEFNEARRRRKPSQEMEHLSSVGHPWEVARYCFCFLFFFFSLGARKRERESKRGMPLSLYYVYSASTNYARCANYSTYSASHTRLRISAIFTRFK